MLLKIPDYKSKKLKHRGGVVNSTCVETGGRKGGDAWHKYLSLIMGLLDKEMRKKHSRPKEQYMQRYTAWWNILLWENISDSRRWKQRL